MIVFHGLSNLDVAGADKENVSSLFNSLDIESNTINRKIHYSKLIIGN